MTSERIDQAMEGPRDLTGDPGRWRYARVLRPILLFGASAHALFLLLFALLDVPVLVAFNTASILLYLLLTYLAPRVDPRWLVLTAMVEVLAHAWLATHYVGWVSGFHFYPLILIPLIAFLTRFTVVQRCLLILLTTALYSAMALAYTTAGPLVPLPDAVAPWLSAINAVSVSIGMSVFILFYAVAVQNADDLVRSSQERLKRLAATDPLTGLLNRRSMDAHLQRVVEGRGPATLLLGDVDNFKQINDVFGHDTGDRVLEAVGEALRQAAADRALVARWGGEEFLILVPDDDGTQADELAARIRRLVSQCRRDRHRPLTMSIGITSLRAGDTVARFANRADQALLAAKRAGRDRVITASSAGAAGT
ncbi:GGDEF domain-containing protein [Aquisalimonas asiatica]|uniref:diguanylate cyclase n=1 Tax=Aquisalimonas asiatica TaxID=406100 RepID=A0A1H8Q437_9GAMM|nr:GGDEF domain-containing protein [Aquisalimonas asiatica]SEO48979.1 diguanylate cyclase (GGDEF) domain-containing protein [Aquisalimonas asiatica]